MIHLTDPVTLGCILIMVAAFVYIVLTVRKIWRITRPSVPQIAQYELPIYWASYLVNRDHSGLDFGDKIEADVWLRDHHLPFAADVEETGIGRWNGKVCDMGLYTFLT
jgi:hypothetical protein